MDDDGDDFERYRALGDAELGMEGACGSSRVLPPALRVGSNRKFQVLGLYLCSRLVIEIKAIEKDDVIPLGGRVVSPSDRGGLVFKAHRWLYHSTLGSRVIKKVP